MDIEIKGYKNIKNINLELTDNKINMIFGMSGSGKSSVAGALLQENLDYNKTVGFSDSQIIKVNGSEQIEGIKVFDFKTKNDYVIEKKTENMYSILVDDENEMQKAEAELKTMTQKIKETMINSQAQYDYLVKVRSELGGATLTKKGEFKKGAKILSLEDSIAKVKSQRIVSEIQAMPPGKFEWLKKGSEEFKKESICPFCNRKIPIKTEKKLDKIVQFENKAITSFFSLKEKDNVDFFELITYTEKSIKILKLKIKDVFEALKTYEQIKKLLTVLEEMDFTRETSFNIEITKAFTEYFPKLSQDTKKMLRKINQIRNAAFKAQSKTKRILSRKLRKINQKLDFMSIPYEIEAEYGNGRIKSYKLVLKDDEKKEERSQSLSEGEKNIVSLLLFMYQCSKESSNLIIIDDPASSYDDFRRSQILKIAKGELIGKTVVFLSHDSVYAKYAVADTGRQFGKIYYFENDGDRIHLKEINKSDFGDFDKFVIDKIKNSSDYLQKIINLRLLYEASHSTAIYGYLSAIIHHAPKEEVNRLLAAKRTDESKIIKTIKKKHNELKSVSIPMYDNQYTVDYSDYSILERAIYARDNRKEDVQQMGIEDELNEFAHINGKLKVCLNPYEFNFCTAKVLKYLKNI